MSSIASSALARRSRSSGSSNHSSSTRTALLIATANASVGRINGREGTGGARCSAPVVPPARRDPPQTSPPELPGWLLDRTKPQVNDTPGAGETSPRTPSATARDLVVTELGGRHWPLLRLTDGAVPSRWLSSRRATALPTRYSQLRYSGRSLSYANACRHGHCYQRAAACGTARQTGRADQCATLAIFVNVDRRANP
jgi:hypothetical protein